MKQKYVKMLEAWRQSGESHFVTWLMKQEDKCEFCTESCGEPWCITKNKETNNEELKSNEE